jgi:tetratricopeptide (TPR) repeat protein
MVRTFGRTLLGMCALLLAQPAWAEWYEASSDHFVIYADDQERDLRRFAENLERYHSAMAFLIGRNLEKPSPSNRVVIYVVGGARDIRALAGGNSRSVAGFYIPRAGASRAFVQEIRNQKGYPHFSTIILLHEYAHHYLMSATRVASPRWLNEGAAEFFAAATFNDDGSIIVGRAAQHRAGELAFADPVPVRELLDEASYREDGSTGRDAFYGKSWLLYHYLTFSTERSGQLAQYQVNLLNGMTSLAAGEAAFDDLDVLERELKAYVRGRFYTLVLTPEKLAAGAVALRKLPVGEAEILPLQIRSQRGVNREQAAQILPEVRAVAARYPNDGAVQAALSEAEYDAGNDAEAIAAADRAIALDPARTNAYVQKGFALFRLARDADDKAAAYKAALEPFTLLNGLENDHPLPLMYYYRSFVERNAKPPEAARAALERASQLAPFDSQLQLNTGIMLVREGKNAIAGKFLAPLAANPHGGGLAKRAKRLIAMVDGVADGTIVDVSNLTDEVETPDLSGAGG